MTQNIPADMIREHSQVEPMRTVGYYDDASSHNPLTGERGEMTFDLNSQGSEERVSIIVIHKDRPEYLNITLQTIAVCSINNNFELVVVDNGSDQRTQTFLDQLEEDGVKVVRNNENVWWAKAANQGAKAASKDSKYLVFMHHDVTILNPAWLDLMINVSESNKSGLVGLSMRSYDINQQRYPFIDESCLLVSRECWKDAGPFAEELPQEGAPFIFTYKANRNGHAPQCIDQKVTPCAHHFRIFAMDFNEHERFAEKAQMMLPKLIGDIQGQ
jgi:glycosyltransferase involved in cell wall biosynthesis